ncbi:PEP-CTERM sorting domain-containing protein [Glaciecola sp. MF2-115]|uniref:PEP-CTERM sorting domain-containing protein n=1 Tax=Glaciecola sp. MF2-115 TaxID=3384827 RepID=UPI0039A18787
MIKWIKRSTMLIALLSSISMSANAAFIVEQYDNYWSTSLSNMQSYANANAASTTASFSVIDFSDTNSPGNFAGFNLWPSDAPVWSGSSAAINDTFFVRITGTIEFLTSSIIRTWNDDGVFVLIDGVTVLSDPTLHPPQYYFSSAVASGIHAFELYFFENGGGANLEVAFSDAQTQNYNQLTARIPEPSTLSLLGLCVAGLVFGRKFRKL